MYVISLYMILTGIPWAVSGDAGDLSVSGSVGYMPECVVTAKRFEYEDEVLSGMLDTIVVTAPRVRVYGVSTTHENSAGQNFVFGAVIILGAVSLSCFSWFVYRHALYRKHRMQDCTC